MHGAEQEGGPPDPIGQRGAIERHSLTGVDLSLAVQRQMVGVFGDEDLGDHRLYRQSALDQTRRGSGRTTIPWQVRQAYFGRRTIRTRNCAGTASRRSATSSPIRWREPAQQGQVRLSTSTIISTRGRWAGRAPRFARRLAALGLALGGACALVIGLDGRLDLLDLFQSQKKLLDGKALGPRAETVPL